MSNPVNPQFIQSSTIPQYLEISIGDPSALLDIAIPNPVDLQPSGTEN